MWHLYIGRVTSIYRMRSIYISNVTDIYTLKEQAAIRLA